MYILSRWLKPIVVASIMFVSLRYLGLSVAHSLLVCLIPLALGWLNVMAAVGYMLTAISMIVAIGWAVTPTDVRSVITKKIQAVIDETSDRDNGSTTTGT